uniref:RING-type domain-containing protein n=1 Tax=Pyramimonas orientalis virus TaxID=455367 RepID=A0A7L9AYM1_POV01|nr:hypothetical protein HWQ62_00183 [Pyramimonas orientalis virus]
MLSNTIGEDVTSVLSSNALSCESNTVSGQKCTNKHKYAYQLSDTHTLRLSCAMASHRKHIMEMCRDGVVCNVYKLLYTFDNGIVGEKQCVYNTIAISVDKFCDTEYPLISTKFKMSTLKHSMNQAILSHKKEEERVKEQLSSVLEWVRVFNEKLTFHRSVQNEMSKTLSYISTFTKYTPSSKINTLEGTCSICQELMNDNNSSKLYECSHSFHHHCIKKWFENKEHITCPCCRKQCDYDEYFVFSKQ